MQIQQINKEDSERVLITFKNVDGSGSVTTGLGISWVDSGASIDCISAVKYAAGNTRGFVGVSKKDIAVNSFGLAVAWGLADSVALSHVGSSITITAGDILIPGAVAGTFFSSLAPQAASTLFYKYAIAADTPVAISTQAQAYAKAAVRAL